VGQDECPETNRDRFLSSIQQLESVAKLFIMCRPSLDLQASFTNVARIEIFAKNGDIHSYLEHEITRNKRMSGFITQDVNLKKDIIRCVTERAAGM
jgi:hypothetical protein